MPLLNQVPIVLASASPRRRELLASSGYRFEVCPPSEDGEDARRYEETAAEYVARLARQKAEEIVSRFVGTHASGGATHAADRAKIVVACDTVAVCDGEILGKPSDVDDARRMLARLSGAEHEVYSGLCLWPLDGRQPFISAERTLLTMDTLSDDQLDEYLASGAWQGKAGAFGYQDRLGWVHIVEGSETNVVGLPIELLAEMLAEFDKPTQPK